MSSFVFGFHEDLTGNAADWPKKLGTAAVR
jgi:hypothetical protein